MEWSQLFSHDNMPSHKDMELHLGDAATIWNELNSYIKEVYKVKPQKA